MRNKIINLLNKIGSQFADRSIPLPIIQSNINRLGYNMTRSSFDTNERYEIRQQVHWDISAIRRRIDSLSAREHRKAKNALRRTIVYAGKYLPDEVRTLYRIRTQNIHAHDILNIKDCADNVAPDTSVVNRSGPQFFLSMNI